MTSRSSWPQRSPVPSVALQRLTPTTSRRPRNQRSTASRLAGCDPLAPANRREGDGMTSDGWSAAFRGGLPLLSRARAIRALEDPEGVEEEAKQRQRKRWETLQLRRGNPGELPPRPPAGSGETNDYSDAPASLPHPVLLVMTNDAAQRQSHQAREVKP